MYNHEAIREVGNEYWFWSVHKLWSLTKKLPIEQVSVESIQALQENCWFWFDEPTVALVSEHAQRIMRADLRYPILLKSDGSVFDGLHRLAKASLKGKKFITARRFLVDPDPDRKEMK